MVVGTVELVLCTSVQSEVDIDLNKFWDFSDLIFYYFYICLVGDIVDIVLLPLWSLAIAILHKLNYY